MALSDRVVGRKMYKGQNTKFSLTPPTIYCRSVRTINRNAFFLMYTFLEILIFK